MDPEDSLRSLVLKSIRDCFGVSLCLFVLILFLNFLKWLRTKGSSSPVDSKSDWFLTVFSFVHDRTRWFLDSTPDPHVFLNFVDTGQRFLYFASFLRDQLQLDGIHIFWNRNLLPGKEIGKYKIFIPVLSKDYASSVKCLTELACMVKCHRSEGKVIIPIFYDVEPYDVRHQMGIYKEAFQQHEHQFDESIIEQWKDALIKVAEMSREGIRGDHRNFPELVHEVKEKVLLELKNSNKNVHKNFVGIDHRVRDVEKLLNLYSNSLHVVVIHGIGGIGKTTIAKVIYEKLHKSFECCCFLDDVRIKSKDYNGLVNLQTQLISQTQEVQSGKVVGVGKGIEKVKAAIYGKKVLIVLDDVDQKCQFDMLAGKCNWYGAGSKLIVTTRNKEVLKILELMYKRNNQFDICSSYEPPLMNPKLSLQLFSNHAFFSDAPLKIYKKLSKKVVFGSRGIPLALVTMGSLFAETKDESFWEAKLRKLDKVPHLEVSEKLRISYEALNFRQQQIFLDIACFFVGEDKLHPSYMWDECGSFNTKNEIKYLILKSMVKVEEDNKLWMHDHLRELGRQIVREESMEYWHRSRLSCRDQAFDLLMGCKGTEMVQALCLDFIRGERDSRPNCLVHENFENLHNLRFLRLGSVDLDGDFKHLFTKLLWLKWAPSGSFSPGNFHLKNLVILDLSYSQISDDWEGWSQIKMAKKLKVLNLSHCYSLTTTSHFSMLANLEQLILSSCFGVVNIDPFFVHLTNLKTLDLSNCLSLRGRLICYLFSKLESLDISCTRISDLFGLEELKSLRNLNTSGCRSLINLLHLDFMEKLEKLDASDCVNLTEIQGLDELKYLESLDISGCISMKRLPKIPIDGMLEEITLAKCDKLVEVEILGFFRYLKILDISWCATLKNIPNLGNLKRLKKLKIGGFKGLKEIRGLEEMKSLESLDISGWKSIERLPEMSSLGKLREIYARRCVELTEIRGVGELISLELLDISGCTSIKKLPNLSKLENLKTVKVSGCLKLSKILGLEELKSLVMLDISGCNSLGIRPYLPNARIQVSY